MHAAAALVQLDVERAISAASRAYAREAFIRATMTMAAAHEAPRAHLQHRPRRARHPLLRPFLRRLGLCDARRLCLQDLPGRSPHHGRGGLAAADQARLPVRHRDHDLAGARRLRAGGAGRRAGRHPDGRLQADRSVPRAVRLVRALPARLRLHSAADPVGRARRAAEAARHLHRLGIPDRADGGGHRVERAPRPGGGGA